MKRRDLNRKRTDRALVLLSGGIDSAVVSVIAAQKHSYIHFLTFDYSQANRLEIAYARKIASVMKTSGPHTVVRLDFSTTAKLGRSALLRSDARADKYSYGFYVPGRNMIFLAHAAGIAESDEIATIYIGSNLQDAAGTPAHDKIRQPAAGYPDSGHEFLRLAEAALNKGLKYVDHLRIEAPLLQMNKFEAIRLGHDYQFDFRLTWSCYRNGARPCARCPACRARILNFHWAGLPDPAPYQGGYHAVLAKALHAEESESMDPPRPSPLGPSIVPSLSRVIARIEKASPRAREIALEDPVINRTAARARKIASTYHRHFGAKGVSVKRVHWLARGPYTREIMHLLKHVRDLRLEFGTGIDAALSKLRRFSIEPTLNISISLAENTELEVMQTLMRAYSLRPSRVSLNLGMSQPNSYTRLWHICQLSADSYNYWKQLASEAGVERKDS